MNNILQHFIQVFGKSKFGIKKLLILLLIGSFLNTEFKMKSVLPWNTPSASAKKTKNKKKQKKLGDGPGHVT